jgi:hypothetical protein
VVLVLVSPLLRHSLLTLPLEAKLTFVTISPTKAQWRKRILARRLQNKDVDLAIRSEGGGEQVATEISFLSSLKIIAGANCHHAARRTLNHPYLAHQLSDGEIWIAHGGVNPCGLVV